MLSGSARQMTNPIARESNSSPEDFLRAIVDACVSNVAVLDESGSIIYASKAWSLFERNSADKNGMAYFENCRRSTLSESDEDSKLTLADDIQDILFGREREFHRQYCFHSLTEQRPFRMHAARLNLPGSSFRVLITHEELRSGDPDFRNSKERLIELLGTKILTWEGEVEGQQFNYVSEHAVKMLGYPVADWYEPNFLVKHIHHDDLFWVLAAYQKQIQITQHFDLTFRMWASNGSLVWVQNLISVDAQIEGVTNLHGFMIDVSERKRAEEALKDVGGRLIAAQEEERRRVARELHDDFNQRLAVLSIELDQLG